MTPNLPVTRRSFLARTAGLAAAPLLVRSNASGTATPEERVRVGIIGTGSRGRSHIIDLFENYRDRAVVTALCDVNAPSLLKAKVMVDQMYGTRDSVTCGDFRQLLTFENVDAVFITVPEHWHALPAIAAVRAGKHVFVEKPLAYSVVESRAIVDAVEKGSVAFQYGTQQRYAPEYHRACMLARNGYLGTLRTVRVGAPSSERGGSTAEAPVPQGLDYDFWLGPAPKKPYTEGRCDGAGGKGWYLIRDYSGGYITGWGSHDLDIAHWGLDAEDAGPTEVSGEYEIDTSGVYDTAWRWNFECKFPENVTVNFASENVNPHGVRFEGDEGWVFVSRGVIKAEPDSLLTLAFKDSDVRLDKPVKHLEDFLNAIRDGGKTTAHIRAAHSSTTTCHLCNIAGALKRTVRWDHKKEQFLDDPEADKLLAREMRPPWRLIPDKSA